MKVVISIDVEFWPFSENSVREKYRADIERDLYGVTAKGEYGVAYIAKELKGHGLRGVFFVEGLSGCAAGPGPMGGVTKMLRENGQEVGLHIHSEWLKWIEVPLVGERRGDNLKDYSRADQEVLIRRGLENLRECGAEEVKGFRAGNYGANWDTLGVLGENGIAYDSSYNIDFLGSDCGLRTEGLCMQPEERMGVWEFPISFFEDYPGHYRPAQVCACSWGEMRNALMGAEKAGWDWFVIVMHSFEMIRRRPGRGRQPRLDVIVKRRFNKLCEFLEANRERFPTAVFAEVAREEMGKSAPRGPVKSSLWRTGERHIEQLARRVWC